MKIAECPYCEEEHDSDKFCWSKSLPGYVCPNCYDILEKQGNK